MTAGRRTLRRRARRRHGNGSGNGHGPHRWILIAAGVLGALLLAMIATTGGAAIYGNQKYNELVAEVAPPEELLATLPRGGARIYDRNGVLLYEFIDEFGGLRRPVRLNDISEWVIKATVATEDASFYENNGLNTRGIIRAGIENFSPFGGGNFLEGSGGSSITQQLAKNVYIQKEERTERSVKRKLKEAAIALELTDRYTKDRILEWYLNSISYGGIYVGIEAAAEGYFGKTAAELTLAESALLAGVPQSPTLYNPLQNEAVSLIRQQQVLNLMVRHGAITQTEADRARQVELEFRANRFEIEAAHFVLGRVAAEIETRFGPDALYGGGLEVITTLDLTLQHEAQRIIEDKISEFEESSDGHNGALFAMDPKTGQILVYLGSRDYFRDDIEGRNDNVISLNSPGSTLKPFTYITAFMQGWSTGTGILDTPAKIMDPATGQFFSPRNPSGAYEGAITAAHALGNSLNVPAFKAILFAGVGNTAAVYRQVGITTLDNPSGYGPSLTLGGVDITLLDVTFAYSVLANNGVMRGQKALEPHDPGERTLDPVALLRVTNADGRVLYKFTEPEERRVLGADFAYLATSIISDGSNQCITFGCSGLGLPDRPSAQKTGTSEPFINCLDDALIEPDGAAAQAAAWDEGFAALEAYVSEHGDAQVPKSFETESGYRLGQWIHNQRTEQREGNLDEERAAHLEALGFEWLEDLCRKLGDTWAFGYTPHLVAGIWAGNTDNSPVVNINSWHISYRSWHEFMDFAHTHLQLPPTGFTRPPGIEERELCWPSGGLPTKHCPSARRYTGLFASDVLGGNAEDLEALQDTWWQPIDIDTRTGLLAAPLTPAAFVSREVRLVLPEEEIEEWEGLAEWAAELGVAPLLAPIDDSSEGNAPLLVTSPSATQVLSGTAAITGRANSPGFHSYSVEWGRGADPTSWVRIQQANRQVTDGVLATWDTTQVSNGQYTIRVRLEDNDRGTLRFAVPITVDNGTLGAQAVTAPFAQITTPVTGQVLSWVTPLSGFAFSGSLQQVRIEVGAGLRPQSWQTIRIDNQANVSGSLGLWDTTGGKDGIYTIRLTVVDAQLGVAEASVVVTVKNGS